MSNSISAPSTNSRPRTSGLVVSSDARSTAAAARDEAPPAPTPRQADHRAPELLPRDVRAPGLACGRTPRRALHALRGRLTLSPQTPPQRQSADGETARLVPS